MPLIKRYDQVGDEGVELRKGEGLYSDDEFERGINFTAKYIGSHEVSQPSSRVEIVAAMRRIRFEFKAKAVKKRKVIVTISVKGIRVVQYKRNRKRLAADESPSLLEHPIYRIFYVSHDSQDLQIFSYISRDVSSNVFRCSVFKAFRKNHAVQIVRTIGQAFDVCHKLTIEAEANKGDDDKNGMNEKSKTEENREQNSVACQVDGPGSSDVIPKSPIRVQSSMNCSLPTMNDDVIRRAQQFLAAASFKPTSDQDGAGGMISSPLLVLPFADDAASREKMQGSHHHLQMLYQQLELQTVQTEYLTSQMKFLKEQLATEKTARVEAQARVRQLLMQNHELLEHINVLVYRVIQHETPGAKTVPIELLCLPKAANPTGSNLVPFAAQTRNYDLCPLSSASLPRSVNSRISEMTMSGQNISPDSGHREMSSDSLSIGEIAPRSKSTSFRLPPSQMTPISPLSSEFIRSSDTKAATGAARHCSCIDLPVGDRQKADRQLLKEEHLVTSRAFPVNKSQVPQRAIDAASQSCVLSMESFQSECYYDCLRASELKVSSGHRLTTQVMNSAEENIMFKPSSLFACDFENNFSTSAQNDEKKTIAEGIGNLDNRVWKATAPAPHISQNMFQDLKINCVMESNFSHLAVNEKSAWGFQEKKDEISEEGHGNS